MSENEDDDIISDDSIIGWIALEEEESGYVPVTGLYDYFWSIPPHLRQQIISSWIEALETYTSPVFNPIAASSSFEGSLFIFKSVEIEKEPEPEKAEVIQFKRPEE